MKAEKIRNIALVGHGSSGKTTLAEALLFATGVTKRKGSVDQGTSILDSDPEEVRRKITINLALAHLTHQNTWINLVDTPGYFDFEAEVHSALRVADNALFVINVQEGVEVGTENYWKLAEKRNLPRLFFVNKCKLEETDPVQVVQEIQSVFGNKAVPVQFPRGKGGAFAGVVDLLTGDLSSVDDPDTAQAWRESTLESIIELSEDLLNRYLEGEEIDAEAIRNTLREGVLQGELYPILFGDAAADLGIQELLDFLVHFTASPLDRPPEQLTTPDGEVTEITPALDKATALVFKTFSEPHVGELYFVRVFSGAVKPGQELINARTERPEKINQVYLMTGRERKEVNALEAGMMGVLVKLKDTHTGDTLRDKDLKGAFEGIDFPEPKISIAIVPKTREDEEKVMAGLNRLHNEDPSFTFGYDPELKQTLISGLGELHLDVIVAKLKEKFGVEILTEKPRIPYRESIRKPAQGMGKYVKQTGGRGQYGICYIKIEPLPRGQGYEFVDAIFGGAIPQNFRPSVEVGIKKAMEKGVLAGVPVVDVKVTLYDGKYHPVDSSNLAFEIAGSMAFRDAEEKADPYLLEPIYELEVVVPEEYMGDIIGDINARRGRILGMEAEGRYQKIRAHVPLAELYKYATTLRSITKGRGTFTLKFSHYDEVPREIAQRVIEQLRKEQAEEE